MGRGSGTTTMYYKVSSTNYKVHSTASLSASGNGSVQLHSHTQTVSDTHQAATVQCTEWHWHAGTVQCTEWHWHAGGGSNFVREPGLAGSGSATASGTANGPPASRRHPAHSGAARPDARARAGQDATAGGSGGHRGQWPRAAAAGPRESLSLAAGGPDRGGLPGQSSGRATEPL